MRDENSPGTRTAVAATGAVVLLVAAALVPLAAPSTTEPPAEPTAVPSPAEHDYPEGDLFADEIARENRTPVDEEVSVVVELHDDAPLSAAQLRALEVQETYTQQDARYVEGRLPLSAVRSLSRDPQVRAVRVTSPRGNASPVLAVTTAPNVSTVGATALHEAGTTGESVTVGVIDRGFRPSDPSIAPNVGAYRTFDEADGGWTHGTAVASILADTAPNATLHLAAVGRSTTTAEYRQAVEWLRASGADVIVDTGSYFGVRADSRAIERVATAATDEVVFVTSAGNYARRHWAGTHDPNATGDGWIRFGDHRSNGLGEGRIAGRVSVHLAWSGSADYDLFVFRERPGTDDPVASSTRRAGSSERVSVRVPRGRYYVAVRAANATAPDRLELYATHRLAEATANGSLTAPATAPGVIAVGAVRNGSVAPFSSRGPVGNRTGIGVLAPDGVGALAGPDAAGTSYAAPYVAGTAALLRARNPSLSPAELRAVVLSSARDVGPPGPDPAAGHGVVDARAAAVVATQRTVLEDRLATADRAPVR